MVIRNESGGTSVIFVCLPPLPVGSYTSTTLSISDVALSCHRGEQMTQGGQPEYLIFQGPGID